MNPTPVLPGLELPPASSLHRPGYQRWRGRLMPHRPIEHRQFELPLQEELPLRAGNKATKFAFEVFVTS